MGALLKVIDERFSGPTPGRVEALTLRLVSERVTPREVIRRRVEAEVEALNLGRQKKQTAMASRSFLVEVEADSPEAVLNPPLFTSAIFRRRHFKPIESAPEVDKALEAFRRRRFIMLLDDRQMDDLDDEASLMPDSEVVFIYLTPLKGG